ncbi:MAG: CYTH domain-containing protein [Oscillospiraceae bacterium]|jgi:uncharacterized protein YjbK
MRYYQQPSTITTQLRVQAMRQKELIEKEAKGLIAQTDYVMLQKEKTWDKKLIQVNYYYTNDQLKEKHPDVHIRIRCFGKDMYLQIKVTTNKEHNFRECNEYELVMKDIPAQIDEETLRRAWGDYRFGNVKLIGFLVTERSIKNVENAKIMLDRNAYNGKEDYEIEIECDSIEIARQTITALGVEDKMKMSRGKYERFCKTLNL